MAPTKRSNPNNGTNPDITVIIAQQLQGIIPQIVTQVNNNVNNADANGGNRKDKNGNGGNGGNNNRCTYKELLACKPRDFDGKGGVIVLTRWIEKIKSVMDISGCVNNQKASCYGDDVERVQGVVVKEFCPSNEMEKLENKFWNHAMVGANHAAYTDRFHELLKLVPHLVTPESKRIESAILKVGELTDEAVRCGTLSKSYEKRKEFVESSKQGGLWKDNKRAKVDLVGYVTTVRNQATLQEIVERHPNHFRNTCPKLNRAPGQVGNRLTIKGNQNPRNNGNQARGRAFNVVTPRQGGIARHDQ
ncbi:hypothetical protein Tco_1235016 [Tanacetum coccineum]